MTQEEFKQHVRKVIDAFVQQYDDQKGIEAIVIRNGLKAARISFEKELEKDPAKIRGWLALAKTHIDNALSTYEG